MSAPEQVLLIDGDSGFSAMLERLLRAWFGAGLETLRLQNPAELEMLSSEQLQQIDLVFSEVSFPAANLEPRDSIARLAALSRNIVATSGGQSAPPPWIVLTEERDRSLELRSLRAGAAEFFQKDTLQLSLLELRVRRALELTTPPRGDAAIAESLMGLAGDIEASLDSVEDIAPGNLAESPEENSEDQLLDDAEIEQVSAASLREQIAGLESTVEAQRQELAQEYESKLALEKEKNRMQSVFGMYVDPKIVEGILSDEISVDQKGRRQDITVLFADLRGYTTLTESMEPEKVISFLNEFFTSMTEVIMGYEGMVDKYIGDGIMCLYGTPIYDPQHRDNALMTAMEMFSIFELWQTNWESNYGIRPAMGIGLASGDAVVGNVGSFQKISYTAIGDTVNLASRLEALAKPGEVLISSDLYENLTEESRAKYIFEPLAPIEIRGKSGVHQVYKLVQEFDADDILQFG